MKIKSMIILAGSMLFLVMPILALTEEPLSMPGLLIPGTVEGTSTYFEITDSKYLNVFLQSTEEITAILESVPKTISLRIEPSTLGNSSILTIGGLKPNVTYYKFQDSYKNEAVFVSNSQGGYSWTQDLTQLHHIWFQETDGTVFLPQDCSNYGSWDGSTNTCTLNQNLSQSVEMGLSNITLDCAEHSIIGTHAGYGIYLNWKSGVTPKNCNVNNFSYGIYLFGGSDNTLIGNSAVNGEHGILFNSHNNTLVNNTADSNNIYGILIDNSRNNVLTGNAMTNNGYNFRLWGAFDEQNIDTSNTVDGKPIYYLINAANQTYGSSTNAGTFYCVNCDNMIVKDLTLTKNAYGVFFWGTNNSRIENINAQNDLVGIWFENSSSNTLNSNITNSNDWYGALLVDSSNNTFASSTFSQNSDAGVRLHDSSNNIFTDNTISNNAQYGAYIYYYSGARMYHNNFINNPIQVYVTEASGGIFDNGYPDGGNYWSDYTGTDQKFGPNQDQLGSDGIGDTPYTFVLGGQDRYPFIQENGWEKKGVPLYTQVVSDYPSRILTETWAGRPYAFATSGKPYLSCGWTIGNCGCAITSMVMLGRYYDIGTATDDSSVDPANINFWLSDNQGYTSDGRLWWGKAIEYLGFIDGVTGRKMTRLGLDFYNASTSIPWQMEMIDNYVTSSKPAIAYSAKFGHYFVIDNKLAATYTVKDPRWYNTKTLDDPEDLTNNIRDYNNHFDTVNLFSYLETPKPITASMFLSLSSPAELLVTDPLGRRLGRDPMAGLNYNEIPDSSYTKEGPIITSDAPLDPEQIHYSKVIYIPFPISGEYNIQVIGTETGSYTIDLLVYDQTGQSKYAAATGNTAINNIQEFDLSYSTEIIGETEFSRIVNVDIKPGSYPNSINLKSKGVTPVAVLTDKFFNAKDIVINSVIFAGAKPTKGKLEDIDKDGDLDLILHFNTQSLQLSPTSTEAVLTGKLTNGTLIKGTDSVMIVQGAVQQTTLARLFSYINQFIQKLISAIGLVAIKQ